MNGYGVDAGSLYLSIEGEAVLSEALRMINLWLAFRTYAEVTPGSYTPKTSNYGPATSLPSFFASHSLFAPLAQTRLSSSLAGKAL